MKKKLATLLLFLFFNNISSFAILEVKKISLEEAIDLALKTNPQIKMSKLDVEMSKNDIKAANQLKNPSIETFQNIGNTANGNPQQIGVDYVIEILKRGKRKALAQTKSQIASNNQKYEEYNLISEIKIAYINLLLKKSNLNFMYHQKELSKGIYLDTLQKHSSNELPKTDVIQAQIAYNRSVMYYNIAKSEVVSAQNDFNTVMNTSSIDYDTKENALKDDYESLLTLSPLNKNLTFEKIKEYTLLNRRDLKAAKEKIQSAQDNLKIVKSQLIPDIELNGGYGYQTKGMSDTNSFTSGAYAEVQIVNIPLVYRYAPEIKNAQIEIEKAQLNYEDLENDVIRNITDAWEKYTITRENLNFYNRELLLNSKELLKESVKSLNNEEIDLTSFLVSKKSYIELELGYKQALSEYYISFAELLKEMNIDYKELNDFI